MGEELEVAIRIVGGYLESDIHDPTDTFSKSKSLDYSYKKWAIQEILTRLIAEYEKLPAHMTGVEKQRPIDIIESFGDEMREAALTVQKAEVKLPFRVALKLSKELLLLFV